MAYNFTLRLLARLKIDGISLKVVKLQICLSGPNFDQDVDMKLRFVRFCMGNPYSAANVRLGWLLL